MQLDFWQFSHGPIERIVALIAEKTLAAGDRLLVVDRDAERRISISRALWDASPEAFLANGQAGEVHDALQPILLADNCEAANGARFAILADGEWRDDGDRFERTILLFGDQQVEPARSVWRRFDDREDVTRGYFAQEDGKWVKKA